MLNPSAVQLLVKLLAHGERIRVCLARSRTFTYRRIELTVDIERLEFGVGIWQKLRQRDRLVKSIHCHTPATLSHRNIRSHQERVHQRWMLFAGPQVSDMAVECVAIAISEM